MLQGISLCKTRNCYIFGIRVIRIELHFIMLSWNSKCVTWVSRVSIITLINEKQGSFEILHDISGFFTLAQLMENIGNVNNAVSIVGYLIFDSNHKFELLLVIYLLNCVLSPSVGYRLISRFETVFYAVRYINNTGKLNISD